MLGIPGSAVGDGMNLDVTGGPFSADGTDDFPAPDFPADSYFKSSTGDTTGIGVEEYGHKIVFLSFPFEAVPVSGADPDNQKTLMARIMDWFDPPVAGVDTRGIDRDLGVTGWNSPNPFTGSTRLTLVVPRGGRAASIEIYNVTGQVVKTLAVNPSPGVETSVVWDGRDSAGRPVGPGVYLYKLSGAPSNTLKKMVLLE
jgi:hypothetical protein